MTFRTRRFVEFCHTDAAGIVHFAAFFPWMESAEHELLRSLDIRVLPEHSDRRQDDSIEPADDGSSIQTVTWPRVHASCNYSAAARFEDLLDVSVAVVRIGRSSVSYEITFERQSDSGEPPTAIAKGTLTAVCCELSPGGGLKKVDIPPHIREKLQAV